jgi:hypothetical protein
MRFDGDGAEKNGSSDTEPQKHNESGYLACCFRNRRAPPREWPERSSGSLFDHTGTDRTLVGDHYKPRRAIIETMKV